MLYIKLDPMDENKRLTLKDLGFICLFLISALKTIIDNQEIKYDEIYSFLSDKENLIMYGNMSEYIVALLEKIDLTEEEEINLNVYFERMINNEDYINYDEFDEEIDLISDTEVQKDEFYEVEYQTTVLSKIDSYRFNFSFFTYLNDRVFNLFLNGAIKDSKKYLIEEIQKKDLSITIKLEECIKFYKNYIAIKKYDTNKMVEKIKCDILYWGKYMGIELEITEEIQNTEVKSNYYSNANLILNIYYNDILL